MRDDSRPAPVLAGGDGGHPLEPVDLGVVVADVWRDLDVQLTESDAELTVEELPRVVGDEHQLRQLFQNLLLNAVEYGGADPPRVCVSTERRAAAWTVSVRDEGVGIDPDEHERIVERHGGDIGVDSAPGAGATFSVTRPAEVETDDR